MFVLMMLGTAHLVTLVCCCCCCCGFCGEDEEEVDTKVWPAVYIKQPLSKLRFLTWACAGGSGAIVSVACGRELHLLSVFVMVVDTSLLIWLLFMSKSASASGLP